MTNSGKNKENIYLCIFHLIWKLPLELIHVRTYIFQINVNTQKWSSWFVLITPQLITIYTAISVWGINKDLLISPLPPRQGRFSLATFQEVKDRLKFVDTNCIFHPKLLVKCDTLNEVRTLNYNQKFEVVYSTSSTTRIPLLAVFLMPEEGRWFNEVDSNLFMPFSDYFCISMHCIKQ